jgi:multiple sugar transport system ATP-binding protein
MGRAIVREPQAFLMDEPLSNLDAKLRVQMRAQIARIQRDLGVTTVYVTHDQTEAMTLGDRVAVLKRGVLQQVGPPQELYDRPVNLFVAGFIGSPGMNVLGALLERGEGGRYRVSFCSQALELPDSVLRERPALRRYAGESAFDRRTWRTRRWSAPRRGPPCGPPPTWSRRWGRTCSCTSRWTPSR